MEKVHVQSVEFKNMARHKENHAKEAKWKRLNDKVDTILQLARVPVQARTENEKTKRLKRIQ